MCTDDDRELEDLIPINDQSSTDVIVDSVNYDFIICLRKVSPATDD